MIIDEEFYQEKSCSYCGNKIQCGDDDEFCFVCHEPYIEDTKSEWGGNKSHSTHKKIDITCKHCKSVIHSCASNKSYCTKCRIKKDNIIYELGYAKRQRRVEDILKYQKQIDDFEK